MSAELIIAGGLALPVLFFGGVWLLQAPVRGVYLAIFASGMLMTPELPYVREKFAATELFMLATWAAAFTWALMGMRLTHGRLHPLQVRALLWGGLLTLTAVTSFTVNNVFRDSAFFTHSAVETANYVYGYLMFATVVVLVDDREKWEKCLMAWILGVAVVAVVALWSTVTGGPAWTRDDFTMRVSSTLKFSNQVPSYVLPVLAVVAMRASLASTAPVWRLAYAALTGGIAVAVLGTGSRTGFGLLAIGLAAVLLYTTMNAGRAAFRPTLAWGIGLAVAAGVGVFTVQTWTDDSLEYRLGEIPPQLRPVLMLRDTVQGTRDVDETRGRQMVAVMQHALDEAVIGTGPAMFGRVYGMHEVHNTYLAVLVQQGVPGFLALMLWLWAVWRAAHVAARMTPDEQQRLLIGAMTIGFGLLLLYGLTLYGLRQRNIWLFAGLLVALPRVVEMGMARASVRAGAEPEADAGAPERARRGRA